MERDFSILIDVLKVYPALLQYSPSLFFSCLHVDTCYLCFNLIIKTGIALLQKMSQFSTSKQKKKLLLFSSSISTYTLAL